jgi:hypothetical protein
LFTRDPSLNPDDLVAMTQPKVTEQMNEDLCKDFTDHEIGDAMFQIGPLKARELMVSEHDFINGTGVRLRWK